MERARYAITKHDALREWAAFVWAAVKHVKYLINRIAKDRNWRVSSVQLPRTERWNICQRANFFPDNDARAHAGTPATG